MRGAHSTGNLDEVRSPAPAVPRPASPPSDFRVDTAVPSAMSGSSSVAAMKKVVQQLRLEAGLNRVKVSGRGRAGRRTRGASGPGGGWLWAAGGVSPPFRRPPLLPLPAAGLRTGPRFATNFRFTFSPKIFPRLTPVLALSTYESARVTSNHRVISKFAECPGV